MHVIYFILKTKRSIEMPLHCRKKYIVFEDNLLALFEKCPCCGHKSTELTKRTVGTNVHIRQQCSHCSYLNEWHSQPFIKSNMPSGNILLSAAILFSGSLLSKFFRVLDAFGCVSFDIRTFFAHQKFFLHPTVMAV